MTQDLILALMGYALATSITPGPNNLMLMASGANFGLRRTLPHMAGVSLGHGFMTFVLGLGLVQVFESFPTVRIVLTVLCSAYLLWLAWKIANAAPPKEGGEVGTPLTFLQAAAFQWVNPKAIFMSITAQTNYAPEGAGWTGALMVAVIFACINLPSVGVWAWMGVQVKRFLGTGARLRAFNIVMALLLVASLVPILLH
jgi:threonine/homoserine/homoserine lactone efflux protein